VELQPNARESEMDSAAPPPWQAGRTTYRGENYYGLPAVKRSYYGWKAAASYFAEGTGGVSQIVAAVADLTGREEDRPLVRAGRYIAFAGSVTAGALFILDLHTPRRWYNMLRIFRRTSLMSIGSWSLTAFGAFSGLTAAGQLLEDAGLPAAGRWMGRIFEIPAAAAGAMVSIYSGTELEETSLPLWAKSYPLLAPLFFTSNAASAVSALQLATRGSNLSGETRGRLERLGLMARAVEIFLTRRAIRQWKKKGGGKLSLPIPFRFALRSRAQIFGMMGSFPLKLAWRLSRRPRRHPIFGPLAGIAAGLLLPAQVIFAGNSSGRRPEEYLAYTQPAASSKRSSGEELSVMEARPARGRGFLRGSFSLALGVLFVGAVAFARSRKKGGLK
jgi:protein NrfD